MGKEKDKRLYKIHYTYQYKDERNWKSNGSVWVFAKDIWRAMTYAKDVACKDLKDFQIMSVNHCGYKAVIDDRED